MSSWVKSPVGALRTSGNPNGSPLPLRLFRRSAPYPANEDRGDGLKDALDSYEELEKINFNSAGKFEGFKPQPAVIKSETSTPADRRKALYQKFYRQLQEERKPADCVIVSVTYACLEYPKSLSQCLQERGLTVEMLYLQVESGLTRALQDVRASGSPICILVEQKNIALSSCTIIIFSESLKIHRNMPKDQAMDFVCAEHNRGPPTETAQKDPAELAAQASQLLDDFLDREKMVRHAVPPAMRQLLLHLADGVHVYPEELESIQEYVNSRLEHLEGINSEGERGNMAPALLGKPPPLLPTPQGPILPQPLAGLPLDDLSSPGPVPLLPSPGSFSKSKPPPLLSLHRGPPHSLGGPNFRGPLPPHSHYGPPGGPRGPLYQPGPRGPFGSRHLIPSLKNSRPPLLASPGPPLLRLGGQRH